MKSIFFILSLALTAASCGSQTTIEKSETKAAEVAPFFVVGGDWGRAVTAHGDFLRFVGQARLQTAQAEYVLARTRQEYARAYALETLIRSLQLDLRQLHRDERQLRATAKKLALRAKALNGISSGSVSPRSLSSLYYFVASPFLDFQNVSETVVPALSADQFIARSETIARYNPETRQSERVPVELEAFPGGSLLQYLNWLGSRPFKVVVGSEAHVVLLNASRQVAVGLNEAFDRIAAARQAVQEQKASIWQQFGGPFGTLPARPFPVL
jgi:hypothetical protein